MSGNEKSEQIGDAMQLLEQQKQEVAHLAEKIDKVAKAYKTIGSESSRLSVSPTDPEKVFLVGSHLLNQSQLAALIGEYQRAKAALAQTKIKLTGFGITSV
jgi:GTP-binding protein EngB required for normal cell division